MEPYLIHLSAVAGRWPLPPQNSFLGFCALFLLVSFYFPGGSFQVWASHPVPSIVNVTLLSLDHFIHICGFNYYLYVNNINSAASGLIEKPKSYLDHCNSPLTGFCAEFLSDTVSSFCCVPHYISLFHIVSQPPSPLKPLMLPPPPFLN